MVVLADREPVDLVAHDPAAAADFPVLAVADRAAAPEQDPAGLPAPLVAVVAVLAEVVAVLAEVAVDLAEVAVDLASARVRRRVVVVRLRNSARKKRPTSPRLTHRCPRATSLFLAASPFKNSLRS